MGEEAERKGDAGYRERERERPRPTPRTVEVRGRRKVAMLELIVDE